VCLCSPSSKIGSSPLNGCGGNCRRGRKYWQPTAGFVTHITCRLIAKNRDQLRNPTLGNRVRATFTLLLISQFVWVKNWVKFVRFCPTQHNFICIEYLYKLHKEYLTSLTFKFYTFFYTKFGNFHISHFSPLTVTKLSTLKKQSSFLAHPVQLMDWIPQLQSIYSSSASIFQFFGPPCTINGLNFPVVYLKYFSHRWSTKTASYSF